MNRDSVVRRSLLLALVLPTILVAGLWLASTAAAQEPTPEAPVYVVQPGDTLFSIAQRFGTTVETIVAANDIADPSLISVGQKLVIPTTQPELVPSLEVKPLARVHPVRAGETLPYLAFRYGTTIWMLREVNDLHRLGLLWEGQELAIPPSSASHSAVPAYPVVTVSPSPVVQGQTVVFEVEAGRALALEGSFLATDLVFVEDEGRYWSLAGVDSLTAPGAYALTLEASELDTGDRLTMQETVTVTKGSYTTYNVVVPADRTSLLDPALSEAERKKVNAVYAGVGETHYWQGTFGAPLAGELRTTAPFGQRRSYSGGPVSSYHTGHDYGADEGVMILSPMTSTVALAEPLQVRGNAVILDHGLGVFTGFWHLSQINVSPGDIVGKGQVVGLVGNTGLSTGPHLHWEMRVRGVPVDPLQWTRQEFPPAVSAQAPISNTLPVDSDTR
jgi:murein DD-endopeptidase MepM/ murein hydrolase activator NlpD